MINTLVCRQEHRTAMLLMVPNPMVRDTFRVKPHYINTHVAATVGDGVSAYFGEDDEGYQDDVEEEYADDVDPNDYDVDETKEDATLE